MGKLDVRRPYSPYYFYGICLALYDSILVVDWLSSSLPALLSPEGLTVALSFFYTFLFVRLCPLYY